MKGTEKQIAWAESIKNDPIATFKNTAKKYADQRLPEAELYAALGAKFEQFVALLEQHPETESASWWIDNRRKFEYERYLYAVNCELRNGSSLDAALTKVFGF